MYVKSFKDLVFWIRSMELAKEIYRLTEKFPKNELFGLTSQMRKAAVSIASNIAEGKQRNNIREYIHFLGIAYGSAAELETQMILAVDLYGNQEDFKKAFDLINQVQKLLNFVMGKMKAKSCKL